MASSRSTTSLARSGLEGVASLSKVHLSWMKHEDHDSDSDESGSEHGDDSDSDSGSDPESDDSDWSCVNSEADVDSLVARMVALEKTGMICRVEQQYLKSYDEFPSNFD